MYKRQRLLEFINDESCANLKIHLISNGTLFSAKEWAKFPGIHNRVASVRISIDAATKETFERLRLFGIHEELLANLAFLKELRANRAFQDLSFSFTYQVDNFREMKDFVAFGDRMGADYVSFERLQNLTFTPEAFRAKAVHLPDHPLHAEFLDIVRDPVFASKRVLSDFEFGGAAHQGLRLSDLA